MTFEWTVLTVRADSTAWATQILLLSSSMLARLEQEVGSGSSRKWGRDGEELRVHGHSAPSWSRGHGARERGARTTRHLRLTRSVARGPGTGHGRSVATMAAARASSSS